MNARILDVYMDGVFTGLLSMSDTGNLGFAYDDTYRLAAESTPISLSMPLTKSRYPNKVVLPFLQGLLPDNPVALESMALAHHVSASSPYALLEHVGHDVAGALQIVRHGEMAEDAASRGVGTLHPLGDAELTALLRNTLAVYEHGDLPAVEQRMSLAGAQAKVALTVTTGGQWAVPDRGVPTTHIFKPVAADERALPNVDIVEFFCQKVVEAAGVACARTDLWHSKDGTVDALVSTRYDRRRRDDGTWMRLHQEDFCRALSVSPAKKYQRNDGGPGIGNIAQLLRTKVPPEYAKDVAQDFLCALTVNAALLNTDAHAKNYSLLLEGRSVRLAPMYDVLSIAPFLREGSEPLFSMKIGRTYDLRHVFPESLVAEGVRLGIPRQDGERIVDEVLAGLREALPRLGQKYAALDRDGIITRTVEGIADGSPLLKA